MDGPPGSHSSETGYTGDEYPDWLTELVGDLGGHDDGLGLDFRVSPSHSPLGATSTSTISALASAGAPTSEELDAARQSLLSTGIAREESRNMSVEALERFLNDEFSAEPTMVVPTQHTAPTALVDLPGQPPLKRARISRGGQWEMSVDQLYRHYPTSGDLIQRRLREGADPAQIFQELSNQFGSSSSSAFAEPPSDQGTQLMLDEVDLDTFLQGDPELANIFADLQSAGDGDREDAMDPGACNNGNILRLDWDDAIQYTFAANNLCAGAIKGPPRPGQPGHFGLTHRRYVEHPEEQKRRKEEEEEEEGRERETQGPLDWKTKWHWHRRADVKGELVPIECQTWQRLPDIPGFTQCFANPARGAVPYGDMNQYLKIGNLWLVDLLTGTAPPRDYMATSIKQLWPSGYPRLHTIASGNEQTILTFSSTGNCNNDTKSTPLDRCLTVRPIKRSDVKGMCDTLNAQRAPLHNPDAVPDGSATWNPSKLNEFPLLRDGFVRVMLNWCSRFVEGEEDGNVVPQPQLLPEQLKQLQSALLFLFAPDRQVGGEAPLFPPTGSAGYQNKGTGLVTYPDPDNNDQFRLWTLSTLRWADGIHYVDRVLKNQDDFESIRSTNSHVVQPGNLASSVVQPRNLASSYKGGRGKALKTNILTANAPWALFPPPNELKLKNRQIQDFRDAWKQRHPRDNTWVGFENFRIWPARAGGDTGAATATFGPLAGTDIVSAEATLPVKEIVPLFKVGKNLCWSGQRAQSYSLKNPLPTRSFMVFYLAMSNYCQRIVLYYMNCGWFGTWDTEADNPVQAYFDRYWGSVDQITGRITTTFEDPTTTSYYHGKALPSAPNRWSFHQSGASGARKKGVW